MGSWKEEAYIVDRRRNGGLLVFIIILLVAGLAIDTFVPSLNRLWMGYVIAGVALQATYSWSRVVRRDEG
jgi:hypothetical protein